ncbi:MAG: RluA family pseudouridine synthase [Planctomycetes bacterium]|nr:RluA family pseudouridine synthase [Planctomycetota bacterium]
MTAPLVIHCDNHLLVVNKPACVPTVPDESGDESLLDRARRWVEEEFDKPGRAFLAVVHRLDRPVSGVLCFARTSKGADRVGAQFRARTARKQYFGVVVGEPRGVGGVVEQELWKDRAKNRVEVARAPREGSRTARTEWRVLERRGGLTLLALEPHTGRPHQLRVACRSLGTPLVGDLKYGAREALPDKSIALHARRLELVHPTTREGLVFEAPLPDTDVWRGW